MGGGEAGLGVAQRAERVGGMSSSPLPSCHDPRRTKLCAGVHPFAFLPLALEALPFLVFSVGRVAGTAGRLPYPPFKTRLAAGLLADIYSRFRRLRGMVPSVRRSLRGSA